MPPVEFHSSCTERIHSYGANPAARMGGADEQRVGLDGGEQVCLYFPTLDEFQWESSHLPSRANGVICNNNVWKKHAK
jgi:hypothetical protein